MLKTAFQSRSIEPFYTGGRVSIANDGKTLVTAYLANVVITDLETGEQAHRINVGDEDDAITTLQISPDGEYLVVCLKNSQMLIFRSVDGGEFKQIKQTKAHDSMVAQVDIDPTSTLLATGGAEGGVKVWDLKGGYVTHNFKGHGGPVSALKFYGAAGSTDWKLASGGTDNKVMLWDLVKSKCLYNWAEHNSAVTGLDFSQDGKTLISGGRDKIVLTYDTKTGKQRSTIPVMESLEAVGFLGDNSSSIYTGGVELKLWDMHQQQVQNKTTFDLAEDIMISDIVKVQNDVLFCVFTDLTIVKLDSELNIVKRIIGHFDTILDMCYTGTDNKKLAIATNSPDVHIVSLDNLLDCQILSGHSQAVLSLDRSNDGNWLATAGKDKIANLWKLDVTTDQFKQVCTFKGHAGEVTAIALPKGPQPNPKFALTGSLDYTIKLWDTKTGNAFYTRKAHDKEINSVDVSPDDRWFATASLDRTAKIWDLDSGETIGVLKGHRRGIWRVRFSQYDKLVATASSDKTIRLWNLNDYSCVKTFEGHSMAVQNVAWLSQGAQMVSSDGNGLINVWDVKSGELSCTLDNHKDRVLSLAIRDDDSEFVSGSDDGVVTVWNDVSEEVKAEQEEKRSHQVEMEQKLDNLERDGDWVNAILLALELDHPYRLLKLLEKQFDMDDVIQQLETDKIGKLLTRVRDWNTTTRTSQTAQRVLESILKTKAIQDLASIPGIVKLVEALTPYSDRHYKRIDDLIEQTYALDYVLKEMDILL